jgi:hypothetical protein
LFTIFQLLFNAITDAAIFIAQIASVESAIYAICAMLMQFYSLINIDSRQRQWKPMGGIIGTAKLSFTQIT